jgi:hypothetical protein
VSRSVYAGLTVEVYDHGQRCPSPFPGGVFSHPYRGGLESPSDGAPPEVVVPADHWIFLRIHRNQVVVHCTLDVGFRPVAGHRYALDYANCRATVEDLTLGELVPLARPGACPADGRRP